MTVKERNFMQYFIQREACTIHNSIFRPLVYKHLTDLWIAGLIRQRKENQLNSICFKIEKRGYLSYNSSYKGSKSGTVVNQVCNKIILKTISPH